MGFGDNRFTLHSLQIAEDYPYSALEIYSFDSNGNCPDAQFVSIALKARFKEQFRSCRVGPVHREEIVQSEYYFHSLTYGSSCLRSCAGAMG